MRFVLVLVCFISLSIAELKCLKFNLSRGTYKVLTTNKAKCPRGSKKLFDTASLIGIDGPQGEAGDDGEDGDVAVWGNGSAGNLVVSSSGLFETTNPQYQNVTINAGVELGVLSGTTIRATGNCTINGEIDVSSGADGGSGENFTGSTLVPSRRGANFGLSHAPAGVGGFGTSVTELFGGYGGKKLEYNRAGTILRLTAGAFGGGGESGNGTVSGGSGGGGLALYCKGAIIIAGTITADGGNGFGGGGGGAGGLVVLASKTSITNTGVVRAAGGNGGNSNLAYGPGGGGGGGIIHFLAPSIIVGGTNVDGGNPGSITGNVSNSPRQAGSGGGAFGGDGGNGGNVNTDHTADDADEGTDGHVFQTIVDPTSLIL